MMFHSILFDDAPTKMARETQVMPDFFVDLNLDQVIDAITAGRKEYKLKPFFYTPLHDRELVVYRQDVMRDMENATLLKNIKAFAEEMRIMRRYLELSNKSEFHYHREGWFLEAVIVYCAALKQLAEDLRQAPLQSQGLIAFREYVTAYTEATAFTLLEADTTACKAALSSVRYCVLIKGNNVKVRKYEDEIDYSAAVEATFAKFKQGAVKDYRSRLSPAAGMSHVEANILDFVAKLYPDIFAELDRYCAQHTDYLDELINTFDREIQFYVAYVDHITALKQAGLVFCYPDVSAERKDVYCREGFDIALAGKCVAERTPVIRNDFYLEGQERILVVSGPNQGGKTTFARMVGQLHYLASLGCPVPGTQARLFLCDRIFTHFEQEEDIQNLRGKLQDDLVRIYAILRKATPNSLIIMNEIFTSTALQDAIFLGKKVMERVSELDLLCVCVTFIDELASLNAKTVSMVSTIVPDNPALRTYKIVRQPADGLAYAIFIAEKYHLTYQSLKERVQP